MEKNYQIINALNFEAALEEICQNDIIAYDTETTGLNVRKDKVIGFSFTCTPNSGWYLPLHVWDKNNQELLAQGGEEIADILLKELAKKKLIMHNASFDVRVTANSLGINLLNALYADTQLMIHTLREEGPFALKDNAVLLARELGLDNQDAANQEQLELEQNVKANGGKWLKSNKEMFKADLNVLAKYAIADTDITLRLFQYLQQQLEKEHLLDFFYKWEVQKLQKYDTIKMEHRGVYLNMPELRFRLEKITKDLKEIETNVVIALLATEEGQEFVKQRLAEEFPPKNSGAFAQELIKYFNLPFPKLESGKFQINKKTLSNINLSPEESEVIGYSFHFLVDGNIEWLPLDDIKQIQKRLLIAKEGTEHIINISSKQQLGKIVFDLMGIKPLSKTDKGSPQFNEDMIEHLATMGMDWAKELRVYNKLTKIKGSYYERFMDAQEDGIFYPTFKQHGTTSGRYGSDMQQLSRPLEEGSDDPRIIEYTNTLRKLFIPKPGYVFIDDDYEALEPRVFADDAGDQALIDIFELGEDFYSKVAIGAENIEGVTADKKAHNFLKNLFPDIRQRAKAYSLGIRYGMKSGKLAIVLGISKEEAQIIIDNYFAAFPGLKAAMDRYLKEAKTTGKVTSKYGRVRHLPRVKEIYRKYGDDILDYSKLRGLAIKTYTPISELNDIRKEYNNLLNNALNFPIQSAAASLVNRAMIAISEKLHEEKLDAWVSLQIHDQIIVSCREDLVDRVKEIVQNCMENTNKLKMKLIAKPEVARDLYEGH